VTKKAQSGHKLLRRWRNKGHPEQTAYGICECGGWRFTGWSYRMGDVLRGHRDHLAAIKERE
jgi:hypothetical protein